MPDERTYGFSKTDADSLVRSIGGRDREFPELRPRPRRIKQADPDLPETNPGEVIARVSGPSDCDGESFEDLGYHVLRASITRRPFGSIDEMRQEDGGEIKVHDPDGCWFDLDYDPEDFADVIITASLYYHGEPYKKGFNFRNSPTGSDGEDTTYVLPNDVYPTIRPEDDCKKFGWNDPGGQAGYAASIGTMGLPGLSIFKVELPEAGEYRITMRYGDSEGETKNRIQLYDGTDLLDTYDGESEEGEIFDGGGDYDFKSSNRPELRVILDSGDDRDTRIVHLFVEQISPPTRWCATNRCCVIRDFEE